MPEEPEVETPPAPRVFTQEEVNRMLADHKRSLKTDLDKMKAEREADRQAMEELRLKLTPAEPVIEPTDVKGQIELLTNKTAREKAELQSQITQLKKEKDEERLSRLKTERDRELTEALNTNDCIDIVAGRAIFESKCKYDEEDSRWWFITKNDNLVSILDGITEEIPTYLRKAKIAGSGSGSSSGNIKQQEKKKKLELEQQALATLATKAQRSGQVQDRIAWIQKKREVDALRKELQPS